MTRFVFRLPDIGEGIAEAEIVAWHVKAGDRVGEDQPLVDVMTDKATVDLTSPHDGVVLAVYGEPGMMTPVGSVLCELELSGRTAPEDRDAPAAEAGAPSEHPAAPAPTAPPPSPAPQSREILAAPATRARARSLGVDLAAVAGAGPEGRIRPSDLERHLAAAPAANPSPAAAAARGSPLSEAVREHLLEGRRAAIAQKLQVADQRIPHITYVEECDLTDLEALRAGLNAAHGPQAEEVSLEAFLVRALVRTLPEFPSVNALFDDGAGVLRRHAGVHVGVATRTRDGVLHPVLKHAEALDLLQCSEEIARLQAAAAAGALGEEAYSGATISLMSLGALGGVLTTPIINYPEVAILAPNRPVERPVTREGRIQVRTLMNLSSSFDHRIIDGYDAAAFIQAIVRLLEAPALLLMG